jgi:hypothetical protein
VQQPRLPDAGLADDQHHLSPARLGQLEALGEEGHLALAAHEPRPADLGVLHHPAGAHRRARPIRQWSQIEARGQETRRIGARHDHPRSGGSQEGLYRAPRPGQRASVDLDRLVQLGERQRQGVQGDGRLRTAGGVDPGPGPEPLDGEGRVGRPAGGILLGGQTKRGEKPACILRLDASTEALDLSGRRLDGTPDLRGVRLAGREMHLNQGDAPRLPPGLPRRFDRVATFPIGIGKASLIGAGRFSRPDGARPPGDRICRS